MRFAPAGDTSIHYVQEDSPHETGAVLRAFQRSLPA
jgi:hypothetical protein